MSETVKKPMTWYRAFIVLLSGLGSKEKITRLKGLCLIFALAGFLSTPFFVASQKATYSGHRPPEAPLIKSYGVLKVSAAIPRRRDLVFETNQGAAYVMGGYGTSSLYDSVQTAGARPVYMEGFLLRDGKGLFWPTLIASEQGETLVSREILNEALIRSESVYRITARVLYSIDLFFLLVTLVNLYFVKRKNS